MRDKELKIDPTIPGRLTKFDQDEILAASKAGISVDQLAAEYRRRPVTIRKIIREANCVSERRDA